MSKPQLAPTEFLKLPTEEDRLAEIKLYAQQNMIDVVEELDSILEIAGEEAVIEINEIREKQCIKTCLAMNVSALNFKSN